MTAAAAVVAGAGAANGGGGPSPLGGDAVNPAAGYKPLTLNLIL